MVNVKSILSYYGFCTLQNLVCIQAFPVKTILLIVKKMKLSTVLTLTAAVASLTSFAGASSAASLVFNGSNGSSMTLDTTQDYSFEFVSSNGSFRSKFFVPPNESPAIIEDAPGFIIPVVGDFKGTANAFSSFVSKVTLPYFVLKTIGVDSASAAVPPFSDFSDPTLNLDPSAGSAGAIFTTVADGFLIEFDDRDSDSDFNDFTVKVKAVPVPAIVPGIALAAAFFGSKALKRNKKEIKSVA